MIFRIRVSPASRAVDAVMAALLIYFALVQLNDPDPVFWGGFYALCAAVPLLGLFGYRSPALFGVVIVIGIVALGTSLGGTLEYLPRAGEESLLQDMGPDKPYIEETREFIGSVIALAVVSLATFIGSKSSGTSSR